MTAREKTPLPESDHGLIGAVMLQRERIVRQERLVYRATSRVLWVGLAAFTLAFTPSDNHYLYATGLSLIAVFLYVSYYLNELRMNKTLAQLEKIIVNIDRTRADEYLFTRYHYNSDFAFIFRLHIEQALWLALILFILFMRTFALEMVAST